MPAAGDTIFAIEIQDLINATIAKPLVKLRAGASAQSFADNVAAPVQFGASTEVVDTHNYHDTVTNNTRVTPTKAGWYRCTGIVWIGAGTTTLQIYAGIYKNGAAENINRVKPAATATACSADVEAVVSLNGSGDYVELYGFQDDSGGTARTVTTGAGTACVLEVEFLRPL
jgi:hypothetical protein